MERIKDLLAKPCSIIQKLGKHGLLKWMSDETYLKIVFRCDSGKKLNLTDPKSFSEKIQWVKLYDRKPEYKTFVDKYEVRELIKEKIGEEYLIPLIAVYESVEEIDWDKLPERFVMKCSHDSGTVVICKDKRAFNREEALKKLRYSFARELFWYGREWAYEGVTPRIVVEEFLSHDDQEPDDYKVLCFNGVPKEIEVHRDRFGDHKLQDFDVDWNPVNHDFEGYGKFEVQCEKPQCLEAMLSLSEKLAKETYIGRVDWFIFNGRLYFGEITLYEASGFFGGAFKKWDEEVGAMIKLPL